MGRGAHQVTAGWPGGESRALPAGGGRCGTGTALAPSPQPMPPWPQPSQMLSHMRIAACVHGPCRWAGPRFTAARLSTGEAASALGLLGLQIPQTPPRTPVWASQRCLQGMPVSGPCSAAVPGSSHGILLPQPGMVALICNICFSRGRRRKQQV